VFDCTLSLVRMELAQFDEIWTSSEDFRPTLAAMVASGDILFEEQELFGMYFGNIAAYTLHFMILWFNQLNLVLPESERFYPKTPGGKVEVEIPLSQRQQKWLTVSDSSV
jgi:hypothetical protein